MSNAPLHRSHHGKGKAEGVSYPDAIKTKLNKIKKDIKAGEYCDNPNALIDKLNNLSKIILGKIDKFRWTITADGQDYKTGNNGCAGVTSITNKPNRACPCDRQHDLTRESEKIVLNRNTQPLEIGK